jgi:Protein of unknown function (DUF2889)
MNQPAFPTSPPGLWRRIVLHPGSNAHGGWIGGALEDDIHRFHMRLDHAEGRITRAHAQALRHPWSACPGAAPHIAGELVGALLAEIAQRDPALHCTHLYDLTVVLAAHVHDTAPMQFDMRVADRVEERTTATLEENGAPVLHWQLEGSMVLGGDHVGQDLRKLSIWKHELSPRDAERATILRRAVFVSGGRQFVPPPGLRFAADHSPSRQGVCFNYQQPMAATSTRSPNWRRDFSLTEDQPLADFEPAKVFAAMAI